MEMEVIPSGGQPAGTAAPVALAAPAEQSVLDMLGHDDEDTVLPALPEQELGVVKVDASARKALIPKLKIKQDGSVGFSPDFAVGAITLDGEIPVSVQKGPNNYHQANLTILMYWQGYEDNTDMGYKGPRNTYNTLDDIMKVEKTALGFPPKLAMRLPKGYERLYEPNFKAATVRECGRMLALVEQPEGIDAPSAFPYEFAGKRYALCRWFMSGQAIWSAGKAIVDTSTVWKPLPGKIMSAKWTMWTEITDSKQAVGKKFAKPFIRIERDPKTFKVAVNSTEFLKWVLELVPHAKKMMEAPSTEQAPVADAPPAPQG